MPDSTAEKGLGSTGLERLIGRIKAYVMPDNATIERKQDGTLGLKSGGIQSEFLASGAVTTDKIASKAVTSDKLADGSVDVVAISDIQGLRAEMGLGDTLGALPIANGGTGATDAATALQNLGVILTDEVSSLSAADGYAISPKGVLDYMEEKASTVVSGSGSIYLEGSGTRTGYIELSTSIGNADVFSVSSDKRTVTIKTAGTYTFNVTCSSTADSSGDNSFFTASSGYEVGGVSYEVASAASSKTQDVTDKFVDFKDIYCAANTQVKFYGKHERTSGSTGYNNDSTHTISFSIRKA